MQGVLLGPLVLLSRVSITYLQGAVSHFGRFVGQKLQCILAVRRTPKNHVRAALVFLVLSNFIRALN